MTELADTASSFMLAERLEALRKQATAELDPSRRAEMGQFLTPPPVAALMAGMFRPMEEVRLLDAGAGVGSLAGAAVAAFLAAPVRPRRIDVVAYEMEPRLGRYLRRAMELCKGACAEAGVAFSARVEPTDFLEAAARAYHAGSAPFNCAILNPPYRKIRTDSSERETCRAMGLEVSNLYAGFVGGAVHLLEPDGQIVAITPRSFANGAYFRAFRGFLLSRLALDRLHVFDSRSRAFRDDAVLQENLIMHATRSRSTRETVLITASETADSHVRGRAFPSGRVVYPHDREQFIHIIDGEAGDRIAESMARFDHYLTDLGISVSTGPVVDFRVPELLRAQPGADTCPLLYPAHMNGGSVHWPREKAKWNALALRAGAGSLTVPNGDYVLVKRFTAKEERKRVVATVFEAGQVGTQCVAFENHLNFFHENGHGLPLQLARGLATYLNSTLVDSYFRQFSGHTQVNASDLRNMPYPSREQLERAGREQRTGSSSQDDVDRILAEVIL